MKTPSTKAKDEAFTLVELLAVIFILAILAALLLPAKAGRGTNYTARCMNNQKQIALGFITWEGDHNGQFPWQISSTNGGTMEYAARGYAAPNFQILSDYLKTPLIFICPTDKIKTVATNGAPVNNQHVSYFAAFETGANATTSFLTGDRNLENNANPVKPGLFIYAYSNRMSMSWTHELHPISSPSYLSFGILSFADGHVERVMGANLNSIFQREDLETNHLAVP